MLNFLLHTYMDMFVVYRASQDSGLWMVNRKQFGDFLESFFTTKGVM